MSTELVMSIVALLFAITTLIAKVVDMIKVRTKTGDNSPQIRMLTEPELRELHSWTKEMYVWHAKDDELGRKVWYFDHTTSEVLRRISEAMVLQTEILRRMDERLEKVFDK